MTRISIFISLMVIHSNTVYPAKGWSQATRTQVNSLINTLLGEFMSIMTSHLWRVEKDKCPSPSCSSVFQNICWRSWFFCQGSPHCYPEHTASLWGRYWPEMFSSWCDWGISSHYISPRLAEGPTCPRAVLCTLKERPPEDAGVVSLALTDKLFRSWEEEAEMAG